MPEYLAPGVYVEEINTGPRPIEGVSTSTAGFIGMTERGPEQARLITSWLQYQRWYGGFIEGSYLPYAVRGFFDNGGQRCYIARVVASHDGGAQRAPVSRQFGNLTVTAKGRGSWGNNIVIKVGRATQYKESDNPAERRDWARIWIGWYARRPATLVDFTKKETISDPGRKDPDMLEEFDNLTFTPGASNSIEKVLNAASKLVQVSWGDAGPAALAPMDAPDWLGADGQAEPLPARADFEAALYALEQIDAISLLSFPDEVQGALDATMRGEIQSQLIIQCERLKDRFALISAEQGLSETQARPVKDTSYAAYYYPWIEVYDPLTDTPKLIPPAGHVAGIVARTDIERGVHKAPANEVVRGARALEFPVTKGMQDILNPVGVNCIRNFTDDGRGIRLWGARTMASDALWKYVNVRRLFIYLEESIDQGTQWVVFEPNDATTWAAVRRSLTNFLTGVWRSGALMGATPEEAFFVKCDRTTMAQDDIDNGRLICYIGVAPVKPAEFVIFRISQMTAEANT